MDDAESQQPSETDPTTLPDAAPPVGWERIESDAVAVTIEYDAHVNYAMQQNAVPVVKRVRVTNRSKAALEDVVVALWAASALAPRTEFRADRIEPDNSICFETIDLPFSAPRLVNKDEREQAQLWVEVEAGGTVRSRAPHPLEVLAYGEWAGGQSLPEILAAFVLPNHPGVERLLAMARDRLERATGDPTLDGTQRRDPARARAVLEAIYAAARDLSLTYVSPPASFEQGGQKIRLPERLLETGFATCLDLVCFLAGACEQAGLNPLLVLLEDHALLGV